MKKPIADQIVEGFGYGWLAFLIVYAVFITILVFERLATL